MSRSALGPTLLPRQQRPKAFTSGFKWPGRDPDTHLRLLPRLTKSGALPLLPPVALLACAGTTLHLPLSFYVYGTLSLT
jgi:hypothetical protein